MDIDNKTIGEILYEKRIEKKLSIEDIYNDTRIIKVNIEALEKNDFLHFPNKVYARSFLRDYSNYLCLDTISLLKRFEEEYATIQEEIPSEDAQGSEYNSFYNKLIPIFIIFLVLVFIAFLISKNMNNEDKNKNNAPKLENKHNVNTTLPTENMPKIDKKGLANPAPAAKDVVAEALKADKSNVKPTTKVVAKNNNSQDIVNIFALKDVWVRVIIDNNVEFEGIIVAGTSKNFKINRYIRLRGGEASSARVKVNGENLGKLGRSGNPFTFIYKVKK